MIAIPIGANILLDYVFWSYFEQKQKKTHERRYEQLKANLAIHNCRQKKNRVLNYSKRPKHSNLHEILLGISRFLIESNCYVLSIEIEFSHTDPVLLTPGDIWIVSFVQQTIVNASSIIIIFCFARQLPCNYPLYDFRKFVFLIRSFCQPKESPEVFTNQQF